MTNRLETTSRHNREERITAVLTAKEGRVLFREHSTGKAGRLLTTYPVSAAEEKQSGAKVKFQTPMDIAELQRIVMFAYDKGEWEPDDDADLLHPW